MKRIATKIYTWARIALVRIQRFFIHLNSRLLERKYARSEHRQRPFDVKKYMISKGLLTQDGRYLNTPETITRLKIDIGLSFCAPNSAIWLAHIPDLMVFGFEPNPENVHEILTGSRKRGPQYSYMNPVDLKTRFVLFPWAIDDVKFPCLTKFYMTDVDPGTSSLYTPYHMKLKKIIDVPSVRLSTILEYVPWKRFPYIEHIKIDTQGNDLRVLQSAGTYLSERVVFVTAECSASKYYVYSHTESELDAYMLQQGFEIMPHTTHGGNKTYVNNAFRDIASRLDYETENQ